MNSSTRMSLSLLVSTFLVAGCSTPGSTPLATYELSGGIAGYAQSVVIEHNGEAVAKDRLSTGSMVLEMTVLGTLEQLCATVVEDARPLASDEAPECCDLIIERLSCGNNVYSFDDLDASVAERLRSTFAEILEAALEDADLQPAEALMEAQSE